MNKDINDSVRWVLGVFCARIESAMRMIGSEKPLQVVS